MKKCKLRWVQTWCKSYWQQKLSQLSVRDGRCEREALRRQHQWALPIHSSSAGCDQRLSPLGYLLADSILFAALCQCPCWPGTSIDWTYLPYVRPILYTAYGNVPAKYRLIIIWYSSSILGSWNFHWPCFSTMFKNHHWCQWPDLTQLETPMTSDLIFLCVYTHIHTYIHIYTH